MICTLSTPDIQCVAVVKRRGRLRWLGHLERRSMDVARARCRGGMNRKKECTKNDMKVLGLLPE